MPGTAAAAVFINRCSSVVFVRGRPDKLLNQLGESIGDGRRLCSNQLAGILRRHEQGLAERNRDIDSVIERLLDLLDREIAFAIAASGD